MAEEPYPHNTRVKVPVPFNVDPEMMELEPSAADADLSTELEWLLVMSMATGTPSGMDEGEAVLILSGAVTLWHFLRAEGREHTMAECLRTAIIWSRG